MPRKGSTSPSTLRAKETTRSANGWTRWTKDEVALIMADDVDDYKLAKKLGRSVCAIQVKRCLVKKEKN